jgi:Na+/H+ antiporter NhaD/arsenite permease-like protein
MSCTLKMLAPFNCVIWSPCHCQYLQVTERLFQVKVFPFIIFNFILFLIFGEKKKKQIFLALTPMAEAKVTLMPSMARVDW